MFVNTTFPLSVDDIVLYHRSQITALIMVGYYEHSIMSNAFVVNKLGLVFELNQEYLCFGLLLNETICGVNFTMVNSGKCQDFK